MHGWQQLVIRKPKPSRNYAAGERCPWAKLTDEQREAIPILLRERGYTQRELAKRMRVSQPAICKINRAARAA